MAGRDGHNNNTDEEDIIKTKITYSEIQNKIRWTRKKNNCNDFNYLVIAEKNTLLIYYITNGNLITLNN